MMDVMRANVGGRAAVDADEALRELFRSEYRPLLRLVALLVDDQGAAEDLVQEAFARLHRSWASIRDLDAAPAWLRSTALNLARSGLRRRLVARRARPALLPDAASAESLALLDDDRRAVIEALRTLSARQREVLVLRYWSDASEAEIAALLGVSAGSVKTHAHRGLLALRAALEDRR